MDQQSSCGFYTACGLPKYQYRSFASSARGTNIIFRASASCCRSISLSRNARSSPILSLVKTLNSSRFPGVSFYIEFRYQLFRDVATEWGEARYPPAMAAQKTVLPLAARAR